MALAPSLGSDVLLRIAQAAIAAPAYPIESLQKAWHLDGQDAPIPPLAPDAREAVRHAKGAIALYLAARQAEKVPADHITYTLSYHQCGCLILEHDLVTARAELEQLAKALRPFGTPSVPLLSLNRDVLGTLQWISQVFNDTKASQRYEKWRFQTSTLL